MNPRLPSGFVLGASTAAYQIEGAVTEDGRGPSIWDTFCAEPGRILDNSSGDPACDHYHRLDEDLGLMRELGLQGYRFSIAWPRVLPRGRGDVNAAGLDFYDRLVDGLLQAGIAPMATLYHWDLPQALQDEGGWSARSTVDAFEEYAAVVAGRLADRVSYWCPVNEPNVVTVLGHALGMHAPGKTDLFGALPVIHHLMLGHGRAVRALREAGAAAVGTATNHATVWVKGDTDADRAGAAAYDTLWNRLVADPVLLGRYPEEYAGLMPVENGDLELISAPLDFYGVNYYSPVLVGAPGRNAEGTSDDAADVGGDPGGGSAVPTGLAGLPFSFHPIRGVPTTDFGWPVVPAGLSDLLVELTERYPGLPPLHVTENGCSYNTGPDDSGEVHDDARVEFLDRHLEAVADAIARGVDVRGYWTWSLLDNFEWAEGYTQRFGLVHVDFATQRRTPKASFHWYRDLIRAHSESPQARA
ncbi:glycoside hydrolase family 1 protein [Nocardioides sp.]|uniref:glycoside hydrolase family 1 protein n=1 Tax=Nocardioides sp. TaxID=35761 RepID=UPI002736A9E5|nr:family 1 glycosylhydrolase [Nocardioides sp.]MDP3892791.1 family 1 glycosylhydrolase [Nocardioides sp.]